MIDRIRGIASIDYPFLSLLIDPLSKKLRVKPFRSFFQSA